jgi:hypothetical protein
LYKFKEFLIPCECGCQIIRVTDFEDDTLAIDVFETVFFSKQGLIKKFLERLEHAWMILMGKEFLLYEVEITKDKLKEFKEFINSL